MTNTYRRLAFRRWNRQQERNTATRSYLLLIILIVFSMTLIWETMTYALHSRLLRCYQRDGNLLVTLRDDEVPLASSFFFHETSCSPEEIYDIRLNARQACSVESAALHHPDNSIFVLIVAPVSLRLNETRNKAVRGLLEYSNIKIRHIDFESYLKGTPLEPLHSKLQHSKWPISHASDVLRYTTLYKYRGTYLDLDVIMLKPLNLTNIVGAESNRSLGAGVINFGPNEIGKEMAEDCAIELQRSFDGFEWGKNGPGLITRVLHKKCNTTKVVDMISANCRGFRVLPVNAFYAFPFWKSSMFFRPGKLAYAQRLLNSSLVIHYWGKVSSEIGLPKEDADVPFYHYARLHCPVVYRSVDGVF